MNTNSHYKRRDTVRYLMPACLGCGMPTDSQAQTICPHCRDTEDEFQARRTREEIQAIASIAHAELKSRVGMVGRLIHDAISATHDILPDLEKESPLAKKFLEMLRQEERRISAVATLACHLADPATKG